jgi:hypothetical protein
MRDGILPVPMQQGEQLTSFQGIPSREQNGIDAGLLQGIRHLFSEPSRSAARSLKALPATAQCRLDTVPSTELNRGGLVDDEGVESEPHEPPLW